MYIPNIYVSKWELPKEELFLKKHLEFCLILYLQKYIFRGMILWFEYEISLVFSVFAF